MSILYDVDEITKRLDAKAAAVADMLTDAAMGWKLVRLTEQAAKEVIDGFTDEAFWDEVDMRPQMGAPLTADEIAEWEAAMENDPNCPKYVSFQNVPHSWGVRMEDREDWVGR